MHLSVSLWSDLPPNDPQWPQCGAFFPVLLVFVWAMPEKQKAEYDLFFFKIQDMIYQTKGMCKFTWN